MLLTTANGNRGMNLLLKAVPAEGTTLGLAAAMINRVNEAIKSPQVLSISSSIEAAFQLHQAVEKIAAHSSISSKLLINNNNNQRIPHNAQIIVTTLMSLKWAIENSICLDNVSLIIIDDADLTCTSILARKFIFERFNCQLIGASSSPNTNWVHSFGGSPAIAFDSNMRALTNIWLYSYKCESFSDKINVVCDVYCKLRHTSKKVVIFCVSLLIIIYSLS